MIPLSYSGTQMFVFVNNGTLGGGGYKASDPKVHVIGFFEQIGNSVTNVKKPLQSQITSLELYSKIF